MLEVLALIVALVALGVSVGILVYVRQAVESMKGDTAEIVDRLSTSAEQFYQKLSDESVRFLLTQTSGDDPRQAALLQKFISGDITPDEAVELRKILMLTVEPAEPTSKFASLIALRAIEMKRPNAGG